MAAIKPAPYPPTIIYGNKKPELRLRLRGETQTYFCINNNNLYLSGSDFGEDGTLEMGRFLRRLHRDHCTPNLQRDEPCPAFVNSYKVGTDNEGLATVEIHPVPKWERCGGVRALLDLTETKDERALVLAYLEDKWSDEAKWRDALIEKWNSDWFHVENAWDVQSRRGKLEAMIWATLRFPALIPQVWLNWLHAAPESVIRDLDRNPSRVDFIAFWHGTRNVIEIDGPSHYAHWDGNTYRVDEHAYARNLKIERSLRAQNWEVIRIGRAEIEDAIGDDDEFGSYMRWAEVLRALPFYKNDGYAEQWTIETIAPELAGVYSYALDDEIPF